MHENRTLSSLSIYSLCLHTLRFLGPHDTLLCVCEAILSKYIDLFIGFSALLKEAVHQAIQVLKLYKCDKNITWVYETETGSKQPFSVSCDQLQ